MMSKFYALLKFQRNLLPYSFIFVVLINVAMQIIMTVQVAETYFYMYDYSNWQLRTPFYSNETCLGGRYRRILRINLGRTCFNSTDE